jgi:hypothetical protein
MVYCNRGTQAKRPERIQFLAARGLASYISRFFLESLRTCRPHWQLPYGQSRSFYRTSLRKTALRVRGGDDSMRSVLRGSNSRDFFLRPTIELLERRDLLTGLPPTVVDLHVSSSEWTSAFNSYLDSHGLGDLGYRIPIGSSAQNKSLPWFNLDRIAISFSEDVNVQAADLSISGINATSFSFTQFDYFSDESTGVHVATWTLAAPLAKNTYQIDLNGNGLGPVTDLQGNILDGEWTNNSDTMPSGNGTAGGDFAFTFRVMPGDVNQNASVEYADYYASTARHGLTTASTNYNALIDIDGSGVHESQDSQDIQSKLWSTYASGTPAGTSNDAPTTTGGGALLVTDSTADAVMSLWSAFSDAETADNLLIYSLVSNSDPSLFDTVSINSTTGNLVINAAASVSGRSSITVRATDAGGLSALATFSVLVNYTNLAPELHFEVDSVGYDTWRIFGYVLDDGIVEGLIVRFYGVVDVRATVQADGTFDFLVIVEEENWDREFAQVADTENLDSLEAFFDIGVT